jgi:hypothetical protein
MRFTLGIPARIPSTVWAEAAEDDAAMSAAANSKRETFMIIDVLGLKTWEI